MALEMLRKRSWRRVPRCEEVHGPLNQDRNNNGGGDLCQYYVLIEHEYNGKRSTNHPCKGFSDIMGI